MSRKTVLVTGASRGIGKAIAIKFARKGYNVVTAASANEDRLMQTKKEIEKLSGTLSCLYGRYGRYGLLQRTVRKIKKQFGGIDVLVNNAGVSYIGLLQDMSSEDWDKNSPYEFNFCFLTAANWRSLIWYT